MIQNLWFRSSVRTEKWLILNQLLAVSESGIKAGLGSDFRFSM
jgi:hypothetical protein